MASGITWEKDHGRSWFGRDPEGFAVARISRWGRGRDRGWGWDVHGVASGRAPDPLQARLAAEACYRMAGGRDHGTKTATLHEGGGEMVTRKRKGTMVGDPAVSFALDQFTKDELNDLVHGLAMERLGPGAHGPDVISLLQEWADGLALVRGEVHPVIEAGVETYRRIEAKERAKHEEGGGR